MPFLVTGTNGQVGRALISLLGTDAAIACSRKELPLDQPDQLAERLTELSRRHKITAVINPAAYTAVDLAEKEEAIALRVNAESPAVIARWCADHNIPFVHYSTDYVFNGQGTQPWTEDDAIAPLSAYGRTKAAGEAVVTSAGGRHLIFRTSWVYDATGKNFLNTMLRFGAERETMRVVSDQHGAPTFAGDLAAATLKALEEALRSPRFPSGIYHLCNSGETTWHGFASAIFAEAHRQGLPLKVQKVDAIATSEYPTPAHRPANSRMSLEKIRTVFGIQMPDWRQGLESCMKERRS